VGVSGSDKIVWQEGKKWEEGVRKIAIGSELVCFSGASYEGANDCEWESRG
jgi:hypothetical protein